MYSGGDRLCIMFILSFWAQKKASPMKATPQNTIKKEKDTCGEFTGIKKTNQDDSLLEIQYNSGDKMTIYM